MSMKLLKPKEVAEMIGVETSTIYQWTSQGFIPYVKLGRLVRFNEDDVMKWLRNKARRGRKSRKIEIERLIN